jgi:flagellar hook-associated protein 1 FlgK
MGRIMSLDLALGIARSGLLATQRQLAQTSQNIANADTPGYTRKELPANASYVDSSPLGLRIGEASRLVDQALTAERDGRGADAAAAGVRERLLQRIEAVHGRPEDGDSLADTMGDLRSAFIALRAAPADSGRQQAGLNAARTVAERFNEIGLAITTARQEAQDGILTEVGRVNTTLRAVADLTTRIRAEISAGRSAADLEDERDTALTRLSESLPVKALRQPSGDLVLIARNGLALPNTPGKDAFSVTPASIGPNAYYGPPAGSITGIQLEGVDVTAQLRGGRLSEYVAMRDATLPRFQAELDMAAAQLAWRLESQGLRLYTDPSGGVPDPTAGYTTGGVLGFANTMRLSSAVTANPALLRDGTHAITGTPASGATPFTPNPATGPAGFTTLIDRVLDQGFGENAAAGVPWAAIPTGGLGPNGFLSSPFVAPRAIEAYAATITGVQTAERSEAAALRERSESLQRGLEARLEQQSGVDPDAEMAALIRLQNAYAANARVVNTAQQMFDSLLAIVR